MTKGYASGLRLVGDNDDQRSIILLHFLIALFGDYRGILKSNAVDRRQRRKQGDGVGAAAGAS